MHNPNVRNSKALNALAIFVATLAALMILIPVMSKIDTISSDEVDKLLYKYLDRYNQTIRDNPDVADLINAAETDTSALTVDDRRQYLAYQQKFFAQWEVAWTYYHAGQLDKERWNTWNLWFVGEARRRPVVGWVENREYFSDSFLRHVDDSLGYPID